MAYRGRSIEDFDEARLCYVVEYKASKAFRGELLEFFVAGFVQGFEDCKAQLKQMVPKLDLRRLQPRNSDGEVGYFFQMRIRPSSFLSFLSFLLFSFFFVRCNFGTIFFVNV